MIHSIIATWAFDEATKLEEAKKRRASSRHCPKCHSEQTAAEEKINVPIFCGKCGAEIPPQTVANRNAKKNAAE